MGVFVRVKKYGDRNVIDLSEWGRPFARIIARFLKEKPISVMIKSYFLINFERVFTKKYELIYFFSFIIFFIKIGYFFLVLTQ